MGIAGSGNIAAAQVAYDALFQEMFTGAFNGQYNLYTKSADISAESLTIPITTSFPMVKKMLGTMEWDDIRALSQTITPVPYGAGIRLKRSQVLGDASGVVESTVRNFLATQGGDASSGIEKAIADMLVANTRLGYDGVTLLNDSHPYSNGTGDNLATGVALSYEAYRAYKAQMRKYTDERGINLGIMPDTLMVSPELERTALEIVGAQRPVAFSATAQDATAGIVGAATITNVYEGEVGVIVNPYLGANAWFLMDLHRPGLRPVLMAWLDHMKPVILDKPTDYCVVENDEYGYAIKGILAPDVGLWQTICGRPS